MLYLQAALQGKGNEDSAAFAAGEGGGCKHGEQCLPCAPADSNQPKHLGLTKGMGSFPSSYRKTHQNRFDGGQRPHLTQAPSGKAAG